MASLIELLRSVAGSGETVTLVYNAGSRPGQARSVVPISVTDENLVVVEPGSHVNKTYKLDKIASVELANGSCATNEQATVPVVAPALPDVPIFKTLAEYVEHFRAELIGAGWYLYEEDGLLGIATRFKNGKPKKTASIMIRYFDRSTEVVFDLEAEDLRTIPRELTGRERPWRVDSWRFKDGKTFVELQRAFAIFMAEARASDPSSAKGVWAGH
jgi:hypothetical protein